MSNGSNSPNRTPIELVGVVILALLTAGAVLVPIVRELPVTTALSTAFVLFVPGYVLLKTVDYRRAIRHQAEEPLAFGGTRFGDWTTVLEWTVLSIALSLVIAVGIGLVLMATPVGIDPRLIVVSLCSLALLTTGAALRYRQRLESGYRGPDLVRSWLGEGGLRRTLRPRSRTDLAVTVILVAVLAAIAVGGVYVIAAPGGGPSHTTLALLNDDGEQLRAADYPDGLSAGEPTSLVVEVRNQEGESTTYTVIAQLQRVEDGSVADATTVDRFELEADAGETVRYEHEVTADASGDLRLVYLLYVGDPPENPTTGNAYRSVHLSFEAGGS